MTLEIDVVTDENLTLALPLIADYQRFYGQEPDEERNRAFFGDLVADDRLGLQLIAMDGGEAVGFATLYWVRTSTRATVDALLNDLYVVPEYRGRGTEGVGTLLMRAAAKAAAERGYPVMNWETAPDNHSGQALYDRFNREEPGRGSREIWYHYSYESE
ncbi:GNAT family N-acetyltransferase [Salininema proteolyticum]|uniref:GNAT family N-acetyltransferase n=1 Tax=Salininema proteolyticum TaxID=1607685 RepID=A0ABV8TTA9_9ACTN